MRNPLDDSGLARINNAAIYYEVAGEGQPVVMIHAGVADSRQWNNEFAHFQKGFRVVPMNSSVLLRTFWTGWPFETAARRQPGRFLWTPTGSALPPS